MAFVQNGEAWCTAGHHACRGFFLFDLGMQRALRGCVNRIHKVAQNSPATVRDSLRAPAI